MAGGGWSFVALNMETKRGRKNENTFDLIDDFCGIVGAYQPKD
jgi:hypothetical protein